MERKYVIDIVEDDSSIRNIEALAMKKNGFATEEFGSGEAFLEAVSEKRPDLVILDIRLPGMNGLEVVKVLKDNVETCKIPILMVTALNTDAEMVAGLDGGADDYIAKPFNIMVLVSRVKALLRRFLPEEEHRTVRDDQIVLDLDAMTCTIDGADIGLAVKEYELLLILLQHKGKVLSRDFLMDSVWGTDFMGSSRTLDMHVNKVRKKLGAAGSRIQTVWGIGYKLV